MQALVPTKLSSDKIELTEGFGQLDDYIYFSAGDGNQMKFSHFRWSMSQSIQSTREIQLSSYLNAPSRTEEPKTSKKAAKKRIKKLKKRK